MSNVVPLHEEPMIWVCKCGCTTFHALSDGTGECAACDLPHDFDGSGWIPRADDRMFTGNDVFRDVQGNGSVEFARRRVADLAAGEDVVALVVLRTGGEIHTWSDVETAEQVGWVGRRMGDAVDLIKQRLGQ
jgi:hypothetical protein